MERTPRPDYVPTIREMPAGVRPRERMISDGPAALSSSELLAIILRVGGQGENAVAMANRLLAQFGGLDGLARVSIEQLCNAHGMGEAKATQIKAALELGRRMHLAAAGERPRIQSPADVANLLMLEMGLLDKEELRVVLLDTKNNVLKIVTVLSGSLNAAVVRVGEVFKEAVRINAARLIVVHNHPSGDPTPSPEDVQTTEMIVEAGRLLDVEVLDHVVLARHRFVSMKDRRQGFK